MKRSSIVFFFVFNIVVVIAPLVYTNIRNHSEKYLGIYFVVKKVEITPAFRANLYDKNGNKLRVANLVFYEFDGIQPNDVIVKDSGSTILKVFRMDSLGYSKIHFKINLE